MKAIAPGKLIISGEHAVVYGKPALVMAVNRYAAITVEPHKKRGLTLHLPEWGEDRHFSNHQLASLMKHLRKRYEKFINDKSDISTVLHSPSEFMAYAAGLLLEGRPDEGGISIGFETDLPVGSGMGSSAAAAVGLLCALSSFLDVELTPVALYEKALSVEKLQHGRPSGVDPYVAAHGGFVRFRSGEAVPLPLPKFDSYLVHTGAPESTTGECVSAVREKFQRSSVWDEFEEVAMELEEVFRREAPLDIVPLIRDNHRLLDGIGVVPTLVSEFVAEIEEQGGAAKICGAGAVRGGSAGVVLVFAPEPPHDLCREYGFSMLSIEGEPYGARIV